MSVETTNKYVRANDAYNELFDALKNMDGKINPVLNNALVIISKYLDLWKARNDVHTKERVKTDDNGFQIVS